MPLEAILEPLRRICQQAGRLLGVEHALFDGDPRFITAVRLRFESLVVIIRAVPDDDTIAVHIESLFPESDEVVSRATTVDPWAPCVGREVLWAWALTNQQGYTDALRLEFQSDGEPTERVVELVVAASAIRLFTVSPGE